MKHHLLRLLAALLLLLPLGSCRNIARRTAERIRIEGIGQIRTQGFTHLLLGLRTVNDSGRNLRLTEAEIALYAPGAAEPAVTAVLLEPLLLRRHTTAELATKWRIDYAQALGWLPLLRAVGRGDLEGWEVSLRVKGRCGPVTRNISEERIPVSVFLRTFGLDPTAIANSVQR